MPGKKPTPAQADLLLQLYDLRREARLRQARDWFIKNYHAQSMEDFNRLCPPNSEENASFRMVITYWEMVCALLNCGLLHEDLFFETTGEQYAVWDRLKSILPAFRQMLGDKHALEHLETAARRYEKWQNKRAPGSLEKRRQMMAQMAAAAARRG